MSGPMFEIPQKKYVGESTIISMRMPKDMLEEIDAIVKETGRTRNELMLSGLEFALNHAEIKYAAEK